MSERSVEHATIVVERTYDATPARVFAAWADPAIKARWFAEFEGWESGPYQLDFRVGGRERSSGRAPGGPVYTYDAMYHDIVPDRRIVSTYENYQDETRISVSVGTVEFLPAPTGAGTRLIVTEQGAFLDGFDTPANREQGFGWLLDALGEELRRQAAGG